MNTALQNSFNKLVTSLFGMRDNQRRLNAELRAKEKEREENIKREKIITHARGMIELSYQQYHEALSKHKSNMRTFTELTLNWSAERVFTKHRNFAALCNKLQDEKTWKMLGRKERAFIAEAVRLAKGK